MKIRSQFHVSKIIVVICFTIFLFGCGANKDESKEDQRARMIARAKELELGTAYKAPPGDPLSLHTAGYAKIMCSAVFVTGLQPDFAAEHVGYFTSPYVERANVGKPIVDYEKKSVSITLPNGVTRTAVYTGDQGCVCLAEGKDSLFFKPVKVDRHLPDANTTPWPMGDHTGNESPPSEIDIDKVAAAVSAAFEPAEALTAAFVVTYKGKIIGERYAEGITKDTPLESWSMGKSLTATMLGILIKDGVYTLDQAAPFPQWQGEGDGRAKIRIMDILHMSSGLYCRAPQDPDYDAALGYPDHLYLYTGGVNSFEYAASLPQQWLPNQVGRYRNVDPVLTNYLVRLGVEGRGEVYHTFPQRALFDKIGVRSMVMETDPYGNFLTQGYEFASARDWARLGNLYLQDGVWNGERLLPEGYAKFVSTLAPAWIEDGRPIYGGFFWINGDNKRPIPKDAYMMLGAGGQSTTIIPSHNLVIVRLGHYKGSEAGDEALLKSYSLLMEAIPAATK
jgi:CubicO group peptidase (beta-lactamase class C family)